MSSETAIRSLEIIARSFLIVFFAVLLQIFFDLIFDSVPDRINKGLPKSQNRIILSGALY